MALQGRAGAALGMAAIASFIAGTLGVVALMLASPTAGRGSDLLRPAENFAFMLLGLTSGRGPIGVSHTSRGS